jgi:hypothetical protein
MSFLPGLALGIALMIAAHVVGGRRRGRGLAITLLGAATGGLLAFPVVADIVSDPAASLSSFVGTDDPWSVLRLAPGAGPGTWVLAGFLPVAAVLCFAAAERAEFGRVARAMAVVVAGVVLAWLSAAGYLPEALANPPVYLLTAAFGAAAVVAYGASGLVSGLEQQAFGVRQFGAALLTLVLAVGIGAQSLQVTLAEWEVRPNGLPPAWPVVDATAPGEFRILWIGSSAGDRFPAPGGDPIGIVEASGASLRFGLTDRRGVSALDTGRPTFGPGYDYLRSALLELLAGETAHAGMLLAPLGVRYVVADEGDLPAPAAALLDVQADLDRVPAGGLTIFRNAAALPTAFVATDPDWTPAADASSFPQIAARPIVNVRRIAPPEAGGTSGADQAGEVVVADQFDPGWRIENGGERLSPHRAFGWAISSEVEPGSISFIFTGQSMRSAEMALLGLLWLAALWITRKPVSV